MGNIKWMTLELLQKAFSELGSDGNYIYMPTNKVEYYPTEPYRSHYYGIGLIQQGEIRFYTDLTEHYVSGPAIIFTGTSSIKRWVTTDTPCEMESLLFSEEFLQEKLIESNILHAFALFANNGGYVINLGQEDFTIFKQMFAVLKSRESSKSHFHKEVVRGIVYSMINEIGHLYLKNPPNIGHTKLLVTKFREAVFAYYKKSRAVSFYANLLYVHPKHLSQTVSSETGMPASEWIQHVVILEAKILLQDNRLSISEVADALNFPDQSTFGKYFKKYVGISPILYRQRLTL
ncbi:MULTISPECIES: helix-turn-helix domain-containing protein [Sphingobacterium]|uniref:Helix-turn-helix domain-containing protein n=1 Tax=Sphingobacterium suaedae TaxID=1686402 RepID=A0ABW5KDI0_9SPHI